MDDQEYDIVDAVLEACEVAMTCVGLKPDAIVADVASALALNAAMSDLAKFKSNPTGLWPVFHGMPIITSGLAFSLSGSTRPLYLECLGPDHFKASFRL